MGKHRRDILDKFLPEDKRAIPLRYSWGKTLDPKGKPDVWTILFLQEGKKC